MLRCTPAGIDTCPSAGALAMPSMMSWYPCFKGPALLCGEPCSPCIELTFLQKLGAQACRSFFSFVLYPLSTEFFFSFFSLSLSSGDVFFFLPDRRPAFFLLATRVSLNVLLAASTLARLGQGAAARERQREKKVKDRQAQLRTPGGSQF